MLPANLEGNLTPIPQPPTPSPGDAAIYVHFPFCRHLCTYCDFDTFTGLDALVDSYMSAVVRQIEASPAARATSLYVGGGTPSIMSAGQAGALINACQHRFGLAAEAEATIEANPTDMNLEKLRGFRQSGFNRLSIGVQSADPRLLRLLGRRHTAEDAAASIGRAREAGFENLSLDLIYGIPKQSIASWRETVETVLTWNVNHLSSYMLSVEPGTPMERGVSRGTLQVPPDGEVVEMYWVADELLTAAGFQHYEISNWAQPGRQSTHNLTYWRNKPYLGIGAGAAGFWEKTRYKLLPNVRSFIQGSFDGHIPLAENDPVDPRRSMSDTLILGLRLIEGVSVAEFRQRHGSSPYEAFGEPLEWAEAAGLLERSGDRVKLTRKGILLSNELFEKLL